MNGSLVVHGSEIAEGTVERPKLAAQVIRVLRNRVIVERAKGLAGIRVNISLGICVHPVNVFAP